MWKWNQEYRSSRGAYDPDIRASAGSQFQLGKHDPVLRPFWIGYTSRRVCQRRDTRSVLWSIQSYVHRRNMVVHPALAIQGVLDSLDFGWSICCLTPNIQPLMMRTFLIFPWVVILNPLTARSKMSMKHICRITCYGAFSWPDFRLTSDWNYSFDIVCAYSWASQCNC